MFLDLLFGLLKDLITLSHFEFLSQNSNPAWPVVAIPESSNLHVPELDVRRMVRFIPYQFEGHDKGNSTIDITSLTPLINLYFPCIALYIIYSTL